MSRYKKLTLVLIIGAVSVCAVGALLPFVFTSSAEREKDANALKEAGRLLQVEGTVISYSIAAWSDKFDVTLATPDTSEAAIVAFQVCSQNKIPLRLQWIVRFYLEGGGKAAECEIER
jgi:hypothetical protein